MSLNQKSRKDKGITYKTSTCKYCKSSEHLQNCLIQRKRCGKCNNMNHISTECRTTRHRAVHEVQQDEVVLDNHTEEDRKIDMVNINHINSNAKSPDIIAKLKTSIYQNSVKISYKVDILLLLLLLLLLLFIIIIFIIITLI